MWSHGYTTRMRRSRAQARSCPCDGRRTLAGMDAEGWLTAELAACACSACGQPYGESQVRLIAQREELFFVDLSCPHCGSQAVAIVTVQLDKDATLTEGHHLVVSEPVEVGGASSATAVSVDDVLDMHALLRAFGGDMEQLLAHLDGTAR